MIRILGDQKGAQVDSRKAAFQNSGNLCLKVVLQKYFQIHQIPTLVKKDMVGS